MIVKLTHFMPSTRLCKCATQCWFRSSAMPLQFLCQGIKLIKLKCFMEFTGMAFPGSSAPDVSDKGTKGAARLQDIEWLSSLSEPELVSIECFSAPLR